MIILSAVRFAAEVAHRTPVSSGTWMNMFLNVAARIAASNSVPMNIIVVNGCRALSRAHARFAHLNGTSGTQQLTSTTAPGRVFLRDYGHPIGANRDS